MKHTAVPPSPAFAPSSMKTKNTPAAPAALRGKRLPPDDDDLKKLLGRAFGPLAKVTGWLRAHQPAATIEERFHAETGWHRIYVLKKRRLFYLVPKRGDFRFSMVLGGKAIDLLRQGPFAPRIQSLLQDARRYPEGTAFIFDRKSFEPEIVLALLAAKIAH